MICDQRIALNNFYTARDYPAQLRRIRYRDTESKNAVKTQVWIAVSVYVLVAIIEKELKWDTSLHTLLQILSVPLFKKIPLHQALAELASGSHDLDSAN